MTKEASSPDDNTLVPSPSPQHFPVAGVVGAAVPPPPTVAASLQSPLYTVPPSTPTPTDSFYCCLQYCSFPRDVSRDERQPPVLPLCVENPAVCLELLLPWCVMEEALVVVVVVVVVYF